MVAEPVAVGNLPGDAEQIRDAGVDAVSLERARQLQGAVAVGVEETLVPDRDLVVVGAGHRAVPGTADDVADAGGVAYGVKIDEEPGTSLLDQARGLREDGWWQRLGGKYATYIAYEIEAVELKNFEPMLVPGLLQTESYAREVNVIGRETDPETIDQRVSARMTRQEVLRRKPTPLRMHAILSEASVRTEVGGPDVLHQQLDHLVTVSRLPNVTIQVLRFEAGAHLAISSGFACSASSGTSRHWATSRPWQASCSLSRAVTWRGCRRRTTI